MIAFVSFILFSLLIAYVALLIRLKCSYWQKYGIIGPRGLPIVGNMLQFFIGRKHYGEVYKEIYDSFPNLSYIGIYRLFNEPAILLRGPEMIKEIMIKNFQHFQDNILWVDAKRDPHICCNPFVAKSDKWKQMRSEIVPIFTPNKVKLSFPHIKTICEKLEEHVNNNLKRNCFEAKDLCAKYTLEVVASAAYGLNAQTFTNANSDFTQLAENVFLPNPWSLIETTALLFSPTIGKLLKYHYVPKKLQTWLSSIINRILNQRLDSADQPREQTQNSDFIQWLIEAKIKSGEPIDRELIVGHCGTFLLEGFETSSSLMAFALYEYAVNMEVQKRVLKEIDDVMECHKGDLSYEAIQEMIYLESTLFETLRLHPPMAALLKQCTKRFTLRPQTSQGTEFVVDEGMIFVVPVTAIHTDPDLYPEPHKFKPERFAEQNEKQRSSCSFLGFGEGPRMCPGMRFGMAQSKAGLVTLLSKYSVHLVDDSKRGLPISSTTFLTAAKNGIWLQLRPRK